MRRRRGKAGSRSAADAVSHIPASAGTAAAAGCAPPAGKKAKYNAKGRRVGGIWMASEAQAVRYEQLLDMAEVGMISDLRVEVSYPLVVAGTKIATYRADAVYRHVNRDARIDEVVVEEVKGLETPEWKLKCKLFKALYPDLRLALITKVSGKGWDAEDPELVASMVGRKSSFAEWIKTRYHRCIP